jgi:protein-disulfide isomerase
MNIKRILFWVCFVAILGLIIWGLIVAMNKEPGTVSASGTPMPITAADHVRGPEDAPVTFIEYADYQCPACASFNPVVERLITNSSTTLRFVTRHFPLAQHRNAVGAAQAAEAAGKQGKYWDMAGLLYDNQTAWENLGTTEATKLFRGYAERLTLKLDQFDIDVASAEIKAKIDGDRADGLKIGVNSTPSFFINGKSIINPAGYEAFKKLVDEAALGDSK